MGVCCGVDSLLFCVLDGGSFVLGVVDGKVVKCLAFLLGIGRDVRVEKHMCVLNITGQVGF